MVGATVGGSRRRHVCLPDLRALNHFDCILLVCNDTQFGEKLIQVVTLEQEVPLEQI